jgi:hypothetical protein
MRLKGERNSSEYLPLFPLLKSFLYTDPSLHESWIEKQHLIC